MQVNNKKDIIWIYSCN